jgi:hypothetical protein
MTYTPLVDDYVKWTDSLGKVIEGWVYFKDPEYITIEIGVKCKDDENIADCPIHKKTHILVVCYPQYWHELEYIKNRRDTEDTYKSQQHRYSDIQ